MLFRTRVAAVRRVSPGFLRVTLEGSDLARLVPRGLDQRLKILLPDGELPASLDESLLPETEWRRRWRAIPASSRPPMRSYTVSESRPDRGELDLDFFVHAAPGPGSGWASSARVGDRLVLSAPDRHRDTGSHGVQWRPGNATRVLIGGDETAYPAIRGIVNALGPDIDAEVVLEAGDPADAEFLTGELKTGRVELALREKGMRGGEALLDTAAGRLAKIGSVLAGDDGGFYAWFATESSRVSAIRHRATEAGIARDRVHAQGYWNDRPR
ncbi:siderophore-interacting protein [Salininema proteolyticum]|uniref:Siderophore-interacting protein n=1 Tax=Salininema proteolyticum TaxID=1607685 RepID=A0ABV8TU20_9ACTN